MNQAPASHDAASVTARPARSRRNPAGKPNPGRSAPAKRPGKRHQALVRVPTLDWPSDLFSDNASLGQLLVEDSPLQWTVSAYQPHPDCDLKIAA